MTEAEFFAALTKYKGHPEPLHETTAVLSYEVGRMMEQAMYMHWKPEDLVCRRGFFKSELMDAIAQCYLICGSLNISFSEMLELGIEKAMERWTGKESK
ncbi:hypothetical protein [Dehalococcoides mccartyi]|uniref:hypothetical protein n=1 Tax=Dehalococcoides mccartyi TaxID=61435 RepID=UPI00339206C4